ncbi:hypothetical protein [Nocardia sp. NPDC051570]|uniref:hypothetical protein n=1 Tax=Nocardia sp. NPDC051570 TaxID=3364324 RepID=UPI00378A2D74
MSDSPVLLAVGTQHYARDDLAALDRVPASLRQVVATLRGLGITPIVDTESGYLLDADRPTLFAALRGAVGAASVVIVYYTGHGVQVNNKYYLPLSATRTDLADTAISTRDLLEDNFLRVDEYGEPAADQPTVLVILDCCFSATALIEGMHSLLQGIGNPNVWVMASANTTEYAQDGVFADALAEYLTSPRTGPSQRYLSLEILVGEINLATARAGGDQEARWFPPARRGVTGLLPFFPNPGYLPHVAGFTIDEQRHWLSALDGFYLTGRSGRIRAIEDLAAFLTPAGPGIAIVTGSPGSGKSTLLALPTLLSAAGSREALLRTGLHNALLLRAGVLLPEELDIVGIQARGLNTDQVAAALAGPLGVSGSTANTLLADLVSTATDPAAQRIVVDSVDEAATPADLVEFLQALSKVAAVRVVVGTRRHLVDRLTSPDRVIDLDAEPYRDRAALAAYVRQLLLAAFEPDVTTVYQSAEQDAVTAVAESIAARASSTVTDSFLIARSLALAVRSRIEPLDDVPPTVSAAFDEDLRRLGAREDVARILLAALAWAKGPGLPWENIWVPVARAIAEVRGGPRVDDDDVRWLLEHAGAYIAEDVGPGGRSVFRPFHDLLAVHLRGADPVPRVSERIVLALLDQARLAGSWRDTHPYLRAYLAEHARDAGEEWIEVLLAEPEYLAVADPAILTRVLSDPPREDPTIRSYRRASPLLSDNPSDNLAHLMEAATAVGGDPHPFDESTLPPTYRTVHVWAEHDDSVLAFRAHRSPIADLAFATDPADRPLLVTLTRAGSEAEIWDIRSGRPIGEPTEQGRELRMDPVGGSGTRDDWGVDRIVNVDGRWFQIRHDNMSLLVTDADTGQPVATIRVPVSVPSLPRAILNVRTMIRDFQDVLGGSLPLAVGLGPDERPMLATGDRRGMVRLFALESGAELGHLSGDNRHGVSMLAFAGDELAVAHLGGEIVCWDLRSRGVRASFDAGPEAVTALHVDIVEGTRTFLTGHASGHVRIDGRVLRGHTDAVTAVARPATRPDPPIAASADAHGVVRIWDLGSDIERPDGSADVPKLAMGPARHVAIGTDSGAVRIATAESDGPWPIRYRHKDAISAIAFGHGRTGPLLVTADRSGILQLFDVNTNEPLAQRIQTDSTADTVGCGLLASGQAYVAATGDWAGDIRLWRIDAKGRAKQQARHTIPRPDLHHELTIEGFTTGPDDAVFAVATLRPPGWERGAETTVTLWNLLTGERISGHSFGGGRRDAAVGFASGPDGLPAVAIADEDDLIHTRHSVTGEPLWEPVRPIGTARTAALAIGWTAAGRALLIIGDHADTVRIVDPSTQRPLLEIRRRTTPRSLALTADLLCIRDGDGLAVLRVPDGVD